MQRRRDGIKRDRISVSLDPDDLEYVRSLPGTSDSHKLAKLVTAARMAGLDVDDQVVPQVIDDFIEWLASRKSKSARELYNLLTQYRQSR